MARLEIDWTRCDGHGLCAALAPRHIGRDEWGFPILARGELDDRTAKAVVDVCPALALRAGRVPAGSRR